jgi:HAD superfamily hydrolase (TIGR01490 family)
MNETRHLVIFDLDGTLTRGDTYVPYLLSVLVHRPGRVVRLRGLPWAVIGYWSRKIDNGRLKQRFLDAFLGGCERSFVNRHAEAYVERLIRSGLRPKALEVLEQHRRAGARTILLSASLDVYVSILARRLQFHEFVCTKAEWAGDRLTGNLASPNCYGSQKVQYLRLLKEQNQNARVTAYADQESDIPMLQLADDGILVSGKRRAVETARKRGIRTQEW